MSETPPTPPPAPDAVAWGLTEALAILAAALAAQLFLAALLGTFARGVIGLLDTGVLRGPEDVDNLVVLVTVAPAAILSSAFTIALLHHSVSRIHGRPLLSSLRLKRPGAGATAAFLALGAGVAVVFAAAASLYPPSEDQDVGGALTHLLESGPVGQALWLTLAAVVAPVVEEMLFRGYLYLGARRRLGPLGAGAFGAITFAALHVGETGSYWPALTGIFLLAALLTVILERTGNLTYCICCHLGYNAALVGLALTG